MPLYFLAMLDYLHQNSLLVFQSAGWDVDSSMLGRMTIDASGGGIDQLPRYLLRDRDAIFGQDFREQVRDMGIREVLSTPRSHWQRAYIERVIGSMNASLVGEGLARAAIHSAARNGIGRGVATGRRTALPLRTTGRLSPPP